MHTGGRNGLIESVDWQLRLLEGATTSDCFKTLAPFGLMMLQASVYLHFGRVVVLRLAVRSASASRRPEETRRRRSQSGEGSEE